MSYPFINPVHMPPEQWEEYGARLEEEERQRQLQWEKLKEEEEQRSRARILRERRFYDNPLLFLETEGLFRYDLNSHISSQDLYQIYRDWCIREKIPISTPKAFWMQVKEAAPKHGLSYGTFTNSHGKRCRGFLGIAPLPADTQVTHSDNP